MQHLEQELLKIDSAIELFEDAQNFNSNWNLLAKLIVNYLRIESQKRDTIESLFIESLPSQNKRFIALCILRALNLNPRALAYNTGFRIKVFKLFDKCLIDIYKLCNISVNSQGYDKESHLSCFITESDRALKNMLIIVTLKDITQYEGKVKKMFNEVPYLDFRNFFLPSINPETIITKTLNSVKRYLNCSVNEKSLEFEKVRKEIKSYLEALSEKTTKYGRLFIAEPLNSIMTLLDEDFNNYPISKPAHIKLRLNGKKYPFLSAGERFPINIEILNEGKGYGYDSTISITNHNSEITFENTDIYIGTIDTEKTTRNLLCRVVSPEEIAFLSLSVTWKNFSGSYQTESFDFEIKSQAIKIDWESLKYEQPYSLLPVENATEMVGRKEKLNELIALCRNSDSCFVTGQKRIGKTSLVKILKERIKSDQTLRILPVFVMLTLETEDTISTLVERICKQLKYSHTKLKDLEVPVTNNSFGKIYDFLMDCLLILEDYKIVIIIDEFDQLPQNLYKRGDVGDSFFLAIKNLSTESKISFILVGGERMAFIKNVQAVHLNLFKTISLDYFDAAKSWSDFEDLVRHPVKDYFEIETDAIQLIYSYTLGHPFFTKKICQELYNICVNNHDSHVTKEEMQNAITAAISSSDIPDFAHFWDDGIMEKGNMQEEISLLRKKVFLSLLDTNGDAKKDFLGGYFDNRYGIPQKDFEKLVNELIVRQIIFETEKGIQFRVKFFHEWLKKYGKETIFTTPVDEEGIVERKKIEEESRVKPEEIMEVVKNWGTYCGKEITTDKIRSWLNQFGTNPIDQRLMFKILKNILFYDNNALRTSLREIFKTVTRGLAQEKFERFVDSGRRKRDDIFVSHLEGSFIKSGTEYAKIFADENNLYAENAIPKEKLFEKLGHANNVNALIFVDDFAGTGDSICKNLKEILENIKHILVRKKIIVYIIVVCGNDSAKGKISKLTSQYDVKIQVNFIKILDESDKCFSDYSKVFPSPTERNNAKSICLEYGQKIEPEFPLGYGNCQALIVFPNACPNNSLPILWKETESWTPLFKRI